MKIYFVYLVVCILFCGCEQNIHEEVFPKIQIEKQDGQVVLGDEINDPYLVVNMQLAYVFRYLIRGKTILTQIKFAA